MSQYEQNDDIRVGSSPMGNILIELDSFGKDPCFEVLEERKAQIEKLLTELLKANRELSRLEYSLKSNEERLDFEKNTIEVAKNNLEKIVNTDPIKKCEELLQLNNRLIDVERRFCEANERLIKEKEGALNKAKYHYSQFRKMRNIFSKEQILAVEKLECSKAKVPTAQIRKVQEKINFLKDRFQKEIDNIDHFESKLNEIQASDESSCISDDNIASDRTDYSSIETKTCLKISPVKSNDQKYIKESLGKALTNGLAAIHLLQPTDPVYFLAHYLSHFRHNELMHNKKQNSFEDLVRRRKEIKEYVEDESCKTYGCARCGTEFE